MIEPQVLQRADDGGLISFSLTSALFSHRILSLDTSVTQETCMTLAKSLIQLEHEDPNAPITLLISSPGGDVYAGLGLVSVMESLTCPVRTVGIGLVASMASVILACGDQRSMYARSHVLIHQLLSNTGMAQQTDIDIVAQQTSLLRHNLDYILASHSTMSVDEVHTLTERDCWLTAERAKELCLVDEIIESVDKAVSA